jgi:hypothetical protein
LLVSWQQKQPRDWTDQTRRDRRFGLVIVGIINRALEELFALVERPLQ